jgi:hypothetical protein
MIDHFAAFDLFQQGDHSIPGAVAGLVGRQPGSFQGVCPGGFAARGSDPEQANRCSRALALATRQGIVITLLFFVWAALHYGLGSLGLNKALAAARTARGEAD